MKNHFLLLLAILIYSCSIDESPSDEFDESKWTLKHSDCLECDNDTVSHASLVNAKSEFEGIDEKSIQVLEEAKIMKVFLDWNASHQQDNKHEFNGIYSNQVLYYGQLVDAKYCQNSKFNALESVEYKQEVRLPKFQRISKYFIRLDFDKVVTVNGSTNVYPSYLIFRSEGENWTVCVEGDKLTDEILSRRKIRSIIEPSIEGDFNGDGINEKAWVIRPGDSCNFDEMEFCTTIIRFSTSQIPDIKIDGTGAFIENLSDLNGDGADEIGIQRRWFVGYWEPYYVFTNVQYGWVNAEMLETHMDQLHEPVSFDPLTGLTTLNSTIWNMEGELDFNTKVVHFEQFK